MSIQIKVDRIQRLKDMGNMKAFADIEVNGTILIKGLRVLSGKHGLFVSMPRLKGNDNQWHETVRVLTPEVKKEINSIILSQYQADDDGPNKKDPRVTQRVSP